MDEPSDFFLICNVISAIITVVCLVVAYRYRELQLAGHLKELNPPPLLSPYGRISRGRFVSYFAVAAVSSALVIAILRSAAEALDVPRGLFFGSLPAVPFVVLAAAKRFRDAGQSPYWSLFCLVPLLGLLANLFCIFAPSSTPAAASEVRKPAANTSAPEVLVSAPAPDWLTRSNRPSPASPSPIDSTAPTASAEAAATAAPVSVDADPDEERWATALAELDGKRHRPGLWAKAYSEAMGDENKARALYLAYRVRQLASNATTGALNA